MVPHSWIAVLLLAVSVSAKRDPACPVNRAFKDAVLAHEGVVYADSVYNTYTKTSGPLKFDAYEGAGGSQADALRPAAVVIHGGGFRHGVNNRTDHWLVSVAKEFALRGYFAVCIDYREERAGDDTFIRSARDALEDGKAVVRYLRKAAGQYRIDGYGSNPE